MRGIQQEVYDIFMINKNYDVVVIGAGAAGLMAAAQAGKRGKKVLLIESTGKLVKRLGSLEEGVAILRTYMLVSKITFQIIRISPFLL